MWFFDILQQQLSDFTNPQKRIFIGYLFSALLLAIFWLVLVKKIRFSNAVRKLFSKKIWLSTSSKADASLFIINKLVMALIAPKLLGQLTVATMIFIGLQEHLSSGAILFISPLSASVLFTVIYFIVDDFSRFYCHKMMHRYPWLWRFHRVHHSAEVLTPLTVFRTHPVEGIIFALRSVIVQGVLIGSFVFLYGQSIQLWALWGASIFVFIFNIVGSNLRHSHIALRYGTLLEHVIISPAQHQIHHSKAVEHFDKNFGVVFAFWDKLWGSLYLSKSDQRLNFGIDEQTNRSHHNVIWLYLSPIVDQPAIKYIANYYHLVYCMASKLLHNRRIYRQFMKTSIIAILLFSIGAANAVAIDQVNVYSARKTELIKPLLEQFTEKTGIEVNLITGSADALLTRLRLEGKASPADVFITVDAGRLHRAKEAKVLQPINSTELLTKIPKHLRDQDNQWYGLSSRARAIFYRKGVVDPNQLSTYQNLADTEWQGRVCVRSSNNIYNQSLVASMIEHQGSEQTEVWARSLVENFAKPPAGGDTDQLKALAVGVCDVAIANTYYYGRLINSKLPADQAIAKKIALFWPNQKGKGVHVNISGAGVTASAKNKENAIKLLEFLVSDYAQTWYAEVNNEYPIVNTVKPSKTLSSWGSFVDDQLPLNLLGENNRKAVELMDRAGWK